MVDKSRLFLKINRDTLPQVKDKYPFVYLEYGRLEVDDSSIKWINCEGDVVAIPVATISCILLGPGTTLTHAAVKTATSANCSMAWVGEDSLLFYAAGFLPTANTRNLRRQLQFAGNPKKSLETARKLFAYRFPDAELAGKTLKQMMGMEGHRVRALYLKKAEHYQVGWKGRQYTLGKFELGDITNQILTSCNAALYGIICSVVHSLGYSPHAGFIHSGSPLPFIYDLADLYKEQLTIDLAFAATIEMGGKYNKQRVASLFRERVIKADLMDKLPTDITRIFE